MNFFITIFNNREIALILWLLFILVWALFHTNIRISIYGVLKVFFSKKIFGSVFLMFTYVSFIIFIFYRLSIWDISMLKDTIVWFFSFAIILLINSNKANKNEDFLKNILLDNLKLILIFEFIINLYSFSLLIELFLLPILSIIVMLNTFMKSKQEYLSFTKITNSILVFSGFSFLTFSLMSVLNNFDNFLKMTILKSFLLPVALSVLLLPFIYFFAKYMKYETNKIRQKYLYKNISHSN